MKNSNIGKNGENSIMASHPVSKVSRVANLVSSTHPYSISDQYKANSFYPNTTPL